MNGPGREPDLLAAIDDAEDERTLYRRGMTIDVCIAAASVALIALAAVLGAMSVGGGVDRGGLVIAMVVPASCAIVASVPMTLWWFWRNHTRENRLNDPGINRVWIGGPDKRVRDARRAHENYIMGRETR